MTIVRPFRGVRYDADRVDLSRVIVPPYDVIAADERGSFYDRDPHNAIRFELTRDAADEPDADYADLAGTLAEWRASGVLTRDAEPGLYVMRQRYTAPTGESLERVGFFAALHLEDYAANVVRPHERTLAGPKADRLKLIRAARANLSSVFLLYEDRKDELTAVFLRALDTGLVARARDDVGVEYALARLTDAADVSRVEAFLAERPVVIADGHHRYETALAYRDEQRAANVGASDRPYDSTLAYFANAYAPGSLLLPIHRVVRSEAIDGCPAWSEWLEKLPGWEMRELGAAAPDGMQKVLDEVLAPLAHCPSFVAAASNDALCLFWKSAALGEELMVRLIERDVLTGIFGLAPEAIRDGAVSFPKSAERASAQLATDPGAVALYLNALHPDDVFRVTGAGEVMPQKSTFFYPKIPTGMVFRVHDPDDEAAQS